MTTAYLIWTISALSIVLMLVRPLGLSEAYWATGGALLLVSLGLVPVTSAAHAILQGSDVYLFLMGMMILSELARITGVFEWLAGLAADQARDSPFRLFLLIYLTGIVVTALLSNDATAVVLTPAVLAVVRNLKIDPRPHLIGCALVANAGSFILPISNPANLVVFSSHMPSLPVWLSRFWFPSLISTSVTFGCLWWIFRKNLAQRITERPCRRTLAGKGRLALAGFPFVVACLLTASTFDLPIGASTAVTALVGAVLFAFWDQRVLAEMTKGVAWSVVPLVAGLFVLVESLRETGLIEICKRALISTDRLNPLEGSLLTAFAAGLLSNGINNLPMALITGSALQTADLKSSLESAALIGVDMGPNLSVTGSLATILWLVALRRAQVEITFWQFLKVGSVVMPLSLLGSILALGFSK